MIPTPATVAVVNALARLANRAPNAACGWLDPDRVVCRWVRDTDEGDDDADI